MVRWLGVVVLVVGAGAVLVQRAGRPTTPAVEEQPVGSSPDAAPIPVTPVVTDTSAAVAPPDTLPPPQPAGPVTITWVNVRSDPERDAHILGVLDPGTPVAILASDVGWHQVRAGALTGWVYAEGLTQP